MNQQLQDMDVVARMLAGEHAAGDDGMEKIYWFPHDQEIRLIEVSRSIGSTGEVLPFRFTADPPDIRFESVIALLGSEDGKKLAEGQLELPPGWDSNQPEIIFP